MRAVLLGLVGIALATPALGAREDPALASPPSPALRVGGVFLRVADLKRSVAFYSDRLDLAVLFANDELAALDGKGVMLLLEQPQDPDGSPNTGLAGWTEVVFEVPDVKATHAALLRRGVEFATPLRAVTSDGKRDRLAAAFHDPDGHILSITGWVSRASAP